jgi:voltage-gated anion channel
MANPRWIYALISPAGGSAVMATGIVSTALSLDGRELLSRILLVICGVMWLTLGLVLGVRVRRDREGVRREAQTPAALAAVVATEVLGSRLLSLGWHWAGVACLAITGALWLVLIGPVVAHWVVPTVGASLMLAVSIESLAVLAAAVAAADRTRWLLIASLASLLVGLGLYMLVIVQFDYRQLRLGHGDQWITGGALAISALAAAQITLAAAALHTLAGLHHALEVATVVLWSAAVAWLPALVLAELRWPRWSYDTRRWATAFPVGMYAACSFPAGTGARVPAITDFARVWVWAGVAVWVLVFAAMLHRGHSLVRARRPPNAG